MARGRRCEMGCEDWPNSDDYKVCPACGEPTQQYTNLTPLDPKAARSFVSHAKFEDYYEARCTARGIPTEGPLPCS